MTTLLNGSRRWFRLTGEALGLLEGLPAAIRDAVSGRVVEERDYSELPRALACSESLVRKRVSRGLGMLREQLEEAG
jgi:RNA polymerase sigma-70 factor (ECF subfamily)